MFIEEYICSLNWKEILLPNANRARAIYLLARNGGELPLDKNLAPDNASSELLELKIWYLGSETNQGYLSDFEG